MKSLKTSLIILGSMGILFLGACSSGNQAANPENSPTNSISNTESKETSTSATTKTEKQHGESHGGQIVETGSYHLEFVPEKEANGTHLDLYVLKGENHQTVPNAKVTAQVQLPDGKQKTVSFTYDANDKHYTTLLSDKSLGKYQVKVSADIKGEKVNGRFDFHR